MRTYESVKTELKELFESKWVSRRCIRCRGEVVQDGFQYGCDYVLYYRNNEKHQHGYALVFIHNPMSKTPIKKEITSFSRTASIVHKKAYYAIWTEKKVGNDI